MTDQAGSATTYTYDPLGRLLRALTGSSSDYQYTYDGAGNRLTQTVNGVVTAYTYNAANEMVTAGSTSYTYDANGNRTGSSTGLVLKYNNARQTKSVTPPGGSATAMTYRGVGQVDRASAGTTSFTMNLLGLARETTSGQTTSYVRDPSGALIDEKIGGNRYYYLFDGLGSVVGLTNASGSVINS